MFDGKILHVYRDEITLPDGNSAFREYNRHIGAVCVIPVTAEHPEDAILQADGNSSVNFTRLTSDYVYKVVIPQLSELAGKYGFNGAWVDGECWAVDFDYHPETVAAFERETGISLNGKLPKCKDDLYYNEYLINNFY